MGRNKQATFIGSSRLFESILLLFVLHTGNVVECFISTELKMLSLGTLD